MSTGSIQAQLPPATALWVAHLQSVFHLTLLAYCLPGVLWPVCDGVASVAKRVGNCGVWVGEEGHRPGCPHCEAAAMAVLVAHTHLLLPSEHTENFVCIAE